jgi:hypothetical protein
MASEELTKEFATEVEMVERHFKNMYDAMGGQLKQLLSRNRR